MWESLSCSVAWCNQTAIFQHHETKEAISAKVKRRICFVRKGCLNIHIALIVYFEVILRFKVFCFVWFLSFVVIWIKVLQTALVFSIHPRLTLNSFLTLTVLRIWVYLSTHSLESHFLRILTVIVTQTDVLQLCF